MHDPEGWISGLSYENAAALSKLLAVKLEEEKESAKQKLVAEFNERLAHFGFSPEDLGMLRKRGRKPGEGRRAIHAGECSVCKFTTQPAHDGRKHRSQGDDKKPFTAKELAELGIVKV